MKGPAMVVGMLAIAAACGPVAGPPATEDVTNQCPCSGYRQAAPLPVCSGSICVTNQAIDPLVLVISIPESSATYAGITMAVLRSDLVSPNTASCQAPCVQLPSPAFDEGLVSVDNALIASAPGIGVDLGSNPGGRTSLPAEVLFYPQAALTTTDAAGRKSITYVDAPLAGLPLLPGRGVPPRERVVVAGPNGVPGYGWILSLGNGNVYERDVVPTDDRFPPLVSIITGGTTVNADYPLTPLDDSANPANRQLVVKGAAQDFTGFKAYLRSSTTHRRVSSRATITERTPGPVVINTHGIPDVGTANPVLERVLEPPDGAPLPYLADPLVPGDKLGEIDMPVLYPPVDVTGVLEAAGVPIEGDLLFDSTAYDSASGSGGIAVQPDDKTGAQSKLHYSTAVHTLSNGRYEVSLPAGEYDVFVAPKDPSVGGIASQNHTFKGTSAGGQTLSVAPLALLRGVVSTADGRPLPNARVEARPSVVLAATVDPRRWPRVRATTTGADGGYALAVDPGPIDLFVEPVEGAGFPVATRANLVLVPGETRSLDAIVVPAPISVDMILHDPADNPIVGALVQAFTLPAAATAPSATLPPPYIAIGSWRTDATGHFQMLVTPPL